MSDIITPFAYSDLPAPVAAEVEAATARIKDRLTRQVKDIVEQAHQSLGDNVTLFPPKPWGPKS